MKRRNLQWGALMVVLTIACTAFSCRTVPQASIPVQVGQHEYSLDGGMGFLLYAPYAYFQQPSHPWPLVLFLHGSGERGNGAEELARVKLHGPPKIVESLTDFPFLVLSPQCPESSGWGEHLDDLEAILDLTIRSFSIDRSRVYLTGLSMGGYGVWQLAVTDPRRFAALVPIAGGYTDQSFLDNLGIFKDMPIWVFHGAFDSSVPMYMDKLIVKTLRGIGNDVRFTLYEDAGHQETWERAYSDPALWEWLLQQKR
jgi:predicted peptidase